MDIGLEDLVARIETLPGPCRETDARVAVACGDIRMSNRSGSIAFFQEPAKRGDYAFLSGCVDGEDDAFRSLGSCLGVKHYTASIDAVVALIERELPGWVCGATRYTDGNGSGWADDGNVVIKRYAATPALALLAAFLRAKGGEHGE